MADRQNAATRQATGIDWDELAGMRRVVILLDGADEFERGLLLEWVAVSKPTNLAAVVEYRALSDVTEAALRDAGADADETWLQPVRLAWLSARQGGLVADLAFGRFSAPGRLQRRAIALKSPDRLVYAVAEGATLADLERRYADHASAGTGGDFATFVTREAVVSLERAERITRGSRYKIARLLPKDVLGEPGFRQRLSDIAQQRDATEAAVYDEAVGYLREMAAMQTPHTLDVVTTLYRSVCKASHDAEIDCPDEQIAALRKLYAERPIVFLITHKSMLDTAAFSLVLFDANLPLPLTFGGINLRTPGAGALLRRAGVIFLRRSFQDNEVYKATFRRYIDYLIVKRFSLLWALEGTRSRTGKLLPPRFGLFNYVVESMLRTGLTELAFVPVTVTYDQITEVDDYATEQRGNAKQKEGIGWMLRFFRRKRSHGKIYVRLGKWFSATDVGDADRLTHDITPDDKQALVQTLAFEVAVRMNAASPITATSIITLILLAGGSRALALDELQSLARAGAALIRRRKLEIVGNADFRNPEVVKATLASLHANGIVSYFDEGIERLYSIQPEQHHKAAYYRNMAVHYFVLDAINEIALLDAADLEVGDQVDYFHERTLQLRELFKFEFYFPRRAHFRAAIENNINQRATDWNDTVRQGATAVRGLLGDMHPLLAHGVLRSFADAYQVVADMLALDADSAIGDDDAFLADCMKLGEQRLMQERIFSAESVSRTLYGTALKLARYRGLTDAGRGEERQAFVHELESIRARLDEILAMTLQTRVRPANPKAGSTT